MAFDSESEELDIQSGRSIRSEKSPQFHFVGLRRLFCRGKIRKHGMNILGGDRHLGDQRLAGHAVYADRSARPSSEVIRRGGGGPAGLWAQGISGDIPIVLVRIADIVAYVTEYIQHPSNPGGAGLGGIGPVTEGFVALLFGVGGFMLICFWIGDRA